MMWEVSLLAVLVLGAIKALYQLREVAFIGEYLSTFVAILLIYPAVLHSTLRKLNVRFFERDLAHAGRSFLTYALTALSVFPAFLLANHFYQTRLFHAVISMAHAQVSLTTIAVQVLLVAFPEEFFFRGYLQTLLSRRFHRPLRLLGIPFLKVSAAVPLTSVIFAASHSFITFQWWHFAIFFPSLLFGWLREKTGGLVAPILFHATSNILVNLIGQIYR